MKPVNLFSTATKSRAAAVSAQKRQNCYLERSDDTNSVVAYCIPGLDQFSYLGDAPIRGMYCIEETIYAVKGDSLYKVNPAGTATAYPLSLSTSTGNVCFADNGLELMFVDGTAGYILTLATDTLVNITDTEFVQCYTVCFIAGIFVVEKRDTGQIYISGSYNGLSWNALDYATAESNPDDLVRVYANHGQIYLLGTYSIESWVYTGNLDFPLSRLNESTIDYGLAARWSLAKADAGFIWLAQSRIGGVQVVAMSGGSLSKLSTHDVEAEINKYVSVSDAVGLSFNHNGHFFYVLSFPSDGKTWLYDMTTGFWSSLKSFGMDRYRGNFAVYSLRDIFISDYRNGTLYKINDDTFTENGELIEMEIVTTHAQTMGEVLRIDELQLTMEHGVGDSTGQYSNPQAMLRVSRDDGHTWGNESYLDIGKIGEYNSRARRLRLGIGRKWTFKIRITDPIRRVITGILLRAS